MFSNIFCIDDSIEINIYYIVTCLEWITELIKTNKEICPFQVDLCIGVGKPSQTETKTGFRSSSISSASSDDDDDDKESKKNDAYFDCIGDIQAKLDKNELPNTKTTYKVTPNQPMKPNTRLYGNMLNEMREKLNKKAFPQKNKYPQFSRFVILIDRRRDDNKGQHNKQFGSDEEDDTVYMYTPPSNCRTIPRDYVPEWFISASRTCLLPNLNYKPEEAEASDSGSNKKKDKAGNSDNAKKEKIIKANIGSSSHVKGGLLTCSFIAKSSDCVKAYIYWNGQISRFGADVSY